MTLTEFTKLYIRISSLFHYIENNKCDIYMAKQTQNFDTIETDDSRIYKFNFLSSKGLIEFSIKSMNEEFKSYKVSYINRSTKWMFELITRPAYTVVQPSLGDVVKAKDIDLALLEIETYVSDVRKKTMANNVIHVSELKKLQDLDFDKE